MYGFYWLYFLLAGSYLGQLVSGQPMSIPPRILSKLKDIKTLDELQRKITVIPTAAVASPRALVVYGQRRAGGSVGGVAPSASRHRAGVPPQLPNNADIGIPVIDDFKQGNESCKTVNICVPLPIVQQTAVLLFPKCVDLPQCIGGCCSMGDNCVAKEDEKVKVKYKSWRIVSDVGDGEFEFLGDNMVDMYRHKSCSCTHCAEQPKCNDRQELINCQCVCKNADEKGRCQGINQKWSDEKCECECTKRCPSHTYLNKRTCSCENQTQFRSIDSASLDDDDTSEFGRVNQQNRPIWDEEQTRDWNSRLYDSQATDHRRHNRRPRH